MTGRTCPTPRFPRTSLTVAAAALCASLLLTGCATLTGSAGASGESGGKAPVTVMTWAPESTSATNMPGMPAMAKTYARWVNARGGVGGHELRVLTCNERNDTVSAARCARRAAAGNVVAVVGSYSQHGRAFMSPLEAEGIPYIGGYGVTDEEFSSPLSYPVNGGNATLIAGSGRQLAAHRCERVTLVRPDTIGGDRMPSLISAGLAEGSAGTEGAAADVRAPEDASEYTRQGERALDLLDIDERGTDGACVTAALGERTDAFFDSFRRLREDGDGIRLASVLGSVQQSLVDRTGGAGGPFEGADVTGWYPAADDPAWDRMRAVVREHAFGDNRVDVTDPGAQTTWIAYTVLHRLIDSLGREAVTARSLRRALDSGAGADGIDTGGLTPRLSWNSSDHPGTTEFPRIANTMVSFQRVREGRLVAARDGFVDVGPTLERRRSTTTD
ncbi:ABC transporter substrate-binding protein [Streptomyces zingiberis]|uniref:ABC transporter substrate-binding protein n=1 Tax=Streptomyces zingiberis TaxID=2053010 RepID=A0ABX1BZ26_9ACTN|nr:ABC transporter substrate-binding protein [Streptomyces zingiberis]NJP99913.1 ABC transporter substrate-binding protein [Streptomyces zingiberis]